MGSREGARRVNTLTSPSSGPLKGFHVQVPVMFQFFGSNVHVGGGRDFGSVYSWRSVLSSDCDPVYSRAYFGCMTCGLGLLSLKASK